MKLLLIGSSVLDYIYKDKTCINKPGGVYYSALGLSSIIPQINQLYLLTNYTNDYYRLVEQVYSKFNLTNSTIVNDIPIIHLSLHPDKERDECYQNLSNPLVIDNKIDYKQFDGIFINMITGFDISVDTLEKIRVVKKGILYCDIHSLARGIGENNKRTFRKIPMIERWLKCLDIIQVNESEFLTLSDSNDKEQIIDEIFNYGVKGLIITKSKKGVEGYFKEMNTIKKYFLDAESVNSINSVGCGDIFGSVFFYSYICHKDFGYSLRTANYFAGLFSTYARYDNFIINLEKQHE